MSSLEVAEVRFFPIKDAVEHRTDKYEPIEGTTFLRRGQLFNVGINFKSTYDPDVHKVYLQFFMGPEDGRFETSAVVRVRNAGDKKMLFPPPAPAGDWGARRVGKNTGNAIVVQVVSPVWLPVGKWQLSVLTRHSEAQDSVYVYPGHTYFLFNPWNEGDQTYFNDTKLLNEYILNDVAKIYKGRNSWQTWSYGQFEDCVLPAFELALDQKGDLQNHLRGDPVKVARAISKVVNTVDSETGILWGKWSGTFEDGDSPFDWDRSEDILRRFLKTEKPVRYAQCWVFAGVATTVCRALGIPARSVTNLGSGHDADCSLTVDEMYDHNLKKISTREMIWNFHCWTDVWMSRPELSIHNEYDGWQTIDATPQEESRGSYQLGPAPVSAVLRGHTQVSYDVPFVFTEVNGDKVRWQIRKDRKHRLIDINTRTIGLMILTNEPLSSSDSDARDITAEYKYPEHATAERESVSEAINNMRDAREVAKRKRILIQSQKNLNDVRFGAKIPDRVSFGYSFEVELTMTNTSEEERTVKRTLELVCVDYKGNITATLLTVDPIPVILSENEQEALHRMTVTAEDYMSQIQENQFLRLIATCYVVETNQPWLLEDNYIEVCCPTLRIQIEEELEINKEATVTLSLDGPYNFPLTDCRLVVKGSALAAGDAVIVDLEDTAEFDVFTVQVTVRLQRAGLQKIFAKFTSAQLPKAENWVEVFVKESTTDITNDFEYLPLGCDLEFNTVTDIVSNGDIFNYSEKLLAEIRG